MRPSSGDQGPGSEVIRLRSGAVAVHAKDDNAKAFYDYFGFIASPNNHTALN